MVLLKQKQKIRVRIFVEVMGWPAEHLNEHLKKITNVLREQMKWKLSKEDYAEPLKMGEKMFSSHVEFEAELQDITQLFNFAMTQGPSVIEILEPSELFLTAGEVQDIMADMVSKAQSMDRDIRILDAQNKQFKAIIDALEKQGILKKQVHNDKQGSK